MLKEVIAFPLVTALSWVARIVRRAGVVFEIDRAFRSLFDLIVGIETARSWRDEHVDAVAEYVAVSEIELPESNEELAAQVEDRWRRTETHVNRGETLLAFAVAGAAFVGNPWVTAVLVGLLLVSVAVRLGAVEPLAYTDPDPGESSERLIAKHAWNGGVLAGSRVTGNVSGLQLMRALDPRLYDQYLNEVFVPKLADSEMSVVEAWGRMNPETTDILREKVPEFDGAPKPDGLVEFDRTLEFNGAKASIAGAKNSAVAKGTEVRESLAERQESVLDSENSGEDGDSADDDPAENDDHPGSRDELEDMSYRELQSLAKEQDVQANLSREEITEKLAESLGE